MAVRIEEILSRIRREITEHDAVASGDRPAVDAESLPAIASRTELEYLNRNYALFDPASVMRSHRRFAGPLVLAFKRRFRNLVLGVLDRYFEKERLFLLELIRFQNAVAERSDRLLREMTERTKAVAERNDLFLGALDLRLEAVEARDEMRRALAGPPAEAADGDGESIVAEMAEAFAGDIVGRIRPFVGELPSAGTITVLGCGRGDLCAELATRTAVCGVDASAALVAACRARGLAAEQASSCAYLESRPEASIDALVITRLGERYAVAVWPRLLAGAWRALRPGGTLLCEGIPAGGLERFRWLTARQRLTIVQADRVPGAEEGAIEHVVAARKGEAG